MGGRPAHDELIPERTASTLGKTRQITTTMTTTASTRSSRSPDAMTGALRGSGRTAALRLAADTAQVLGDVANGVVEPSGLRDLTLRLVQGGGIQKKFAELMLPELQDDHDPPG